MSRVKSFYIKDFYWEYGPFAIDYFVAHWAIGFSLNIFLDGWHKFHGGLHVGPIRFEVTF